MFGGWVKVACHKDIKIMGYIITGQKGRTEQDMWVGMVALHDFG